MTTSTQALQSDQALKAKHRSMWALGDYPELAVDLISSLGPTLVEACRIGPGDRVLDVAAGSGNAAIPAAARGANVVASDLTPELLANGKRQAAIQGVELEWREADAEALPFADGEFDVVMSSVGVMFAPHHEATARELLRVCRPGGRIGLINWTPEGFIGQMFATMKGYVPPPPAGAQPPPLWGREEHVRELFGDGVTNVVARRQTVTIDHFADGDQFRDYFKSHYGPTITAYGANEQDPERLAALDRELSELAQRHDRGDGSLAWEYLLFTAERQT
jgi:SAM-dependent methyltransferase